MLRVILRDFVEVFEFFFCSEMWELLKALLACPVEFCKLFRPFSTVILTIAVIVIVVARRKYLNNLPVHKVALPSYLENVGIYSEWKILKILRKIARKQGYKIKYVRKNNGTIVAPVVQEEVEK